MRSMERHTAHIEGFQYVTFVVDCFCYFMGLRLLEQKEFELYSKRLVKDLAAKGIIRRSVESLNLQLHGENQDVTTAECIRTFPTVTFPASLLLKRE